MRALRLSLGLLAMLELPLAVAAPIRFDLPAQALERALLQLAQRCDLQLLMPAELVRDRQAPALAGSREPQQAVDELLRGSGLRGRVVGGTLLIERASTGAADAAPEPVLPVVRARAAGIRETATGPVPGYGARRSSVGTKTDAALIEAPQSISVIGTQELDDKGVTTLAQALEQTPGVAVNPYGFDSRAPDWVVLRGFDGWYTSSYRDALVQNVGITFLGVQTEVYGLERIEVLRGPASVLFGKGDVGGVVNRVSKQPAADAPRELVLQLGRYARRQLAADLGGALDADGQLNYRVVGLGLDTDSQETYPDGQAMGQRRQYLAPSLRWRPDERTSLLLQAEWLRDDASDDVQYVTGYDGQPTRIKEGEPSYSRIKTGSNAVGYQLERDLGAGWTLQQRLRYAQRDMDKHHILSWLADATTLERQARHDVESVRETAVDTSLQGRVRSAAVEHRLLFGLDWDRSRATWRRDADMTTSLDMSHPVYGRTVAEPVTRVGDVVLTSRQTGLYAQDQLVFDPHWVLTLGARHDRVATDNDDRFNAARTLQQDRATTGRVGLGYQVGNGWAHYASYAQSFVPNVGVDSAGQAFAPSRGRQVELGAKYMPVDRPWSFAAAWFDLEKSAVVSYDPATYEPRQIGRVRSRGLELEAKARLSRQWQLTAALSTLDMTVLASANSAEVGRTPILTPERHASLWLDFAPGGDGAPGFSGGVGLRHVGRRWNDEANTSSEPAYTLADAALRYEIGAWRLALNVSNLFDKRYYSGHAYGLYFQGANRNLVATLRYRF